jgi:hypothetical protein
MINAMDSPPDSAEKRDAMLRLPLIGICLVVTLTGCFTEPRNRAAKAANTAMAAACFAARMYPCTIEPSAAERSKAIEDKAASVRADAQRISTSVNQDATRRASCSTDEGPRLPVSSSQCAAYGGI